MSGPAVPPPGGPRGQLRDRLHRLTPDQRRALRARLAPEPAPLTPTQFGIWLFEQLNPGGTAYHNPAALRLRGPLDLASAHGALDLLHRRHDALRIRIEEDDDGLPLQRVTGDVAPVGGVTDLRAVPAAEREERALAVAVASVREPFDLAQGPPWRYRLIRLADDDHVLVVTFHHVVSDGWSLTVILREFAAGYAALAAGRAPDLPPPARSYLDVVRDGRRPDPAERDRLLDHWRDTLAGAELSVPVRPGTTGPTGASGYAGGSLPFRFDEERTAALRAVCRTAGASLFAGLTAAFCATLVRLTGRRDLVFTTPVADRDDPATRSLVGCFLNTVPVRVRVPDGTTLAELVDRTGRAVASAVAHAALPYGEILTAVGAADTAAAGNVMVLHGNASVGGLSVGGLRFSRYRIPLVASKHDLGLLVTPDGRRVGGELEYRADLFDPAGAADVRRLFEETTELLATRPDQPVR